MRVPKKVSSIMGVFTYDMYIRFKKAYAEAEKSGVESFVFDDKKYVTKFAKYMNEYLDGAFKPSPFLGNSINV